MFKLRKPAAPPPADGPALPPPAGFVPAGLRVFAFGDVHGCADHLRRLQALIAADLAAAPPHQAAVVGLGDYVDRGPDSRGVLEALRTPVAGAGTLLIRGNHEAMLLDFLADPLGAGPGWLRMGGLETLLAFGVRARPNPTAAAELTELRDRFARALGPENLALLTGTRIALEIGDYFFVHAGARPGVQLAAQREDDLMWIRTGFADRDQPFEKIIVHGHTPAAEPFVGRYRINVDTGAYATGRLTCIVLEADQRRFLEVRA